MGQVILTVWLNFLPIANIALAIVFLVVIYSTATGMGLSKYSVMKILPRLIVVAIGINVSFYLCAVMADLSNLLGDNIYDFILNAFTQGQQEPQIYQKVWQGITNAGLSIVGLIAVIVIAVLNIGAVLLAVLTIIIAITARSVILSLLVIISPLAFVCALLPNTQKWFQKWLDNYVRLLAIYPIFMGAWGAVRGIQILISNNGDAFDFSHVLALLLPIAPALMIIPLFKATGGIMGKVTGAVQSGIQKSPLGSWAKERDQLRQQKFLDKRMDKSAAAQQAREDSALAASRAGHLNVDKVDQFKQEAAANGYSEGTDYRFDENGDMEFLNTSLIDTVKGDTMQQAYEAAVGADRAAKEANEEQDKRAISRARQSVRGRLNRNVLQRGWGAVSGETLARDKQFQEMNRSRGRAARTANDVLARPGKYAPGSAEYAYALGLKDQENTKIINDQAVSLGQQWDDLRKANPNAHESVIARQLVSDFIQKGAYTDSNNVKAISDVLLKHGSAGTDQIGVLHSALGKAAATGNQNALIAQSDLLTYNNSKYKSILDGKNFISQEFAKVAAQYGGDADRYVKSRDWLKTMKGSEAPGQKNFAYLDNSGNYKSVNIIDEMLNAAQRGSSDDKKEVSRILDQALSSPQARAEMGESMDKYRAMASALGVDKLTQFNKAFGIAGGGTTP